MTATAWAGLRLRLGPGWPKLALAGRLTAAAVLSLGAGQLLHLTLPLWCALTALVVAQISAGKSFKAATDYLAGTLGGAAFAVLVSVLVPHAAEAALLGVLALTVAPMALLAATFPRFAVAPATAVIVILLPLTTHVSSAASAVDRVEEVVVGAVIGLATSFLAPRRGAAAALEGRTR